MSCLEEQAFQESVFLKLAIVFQVSCCFATVLTTGWYFKKYSRKVLHHSNFRNLLFLYLGMFLAHAVLLATIQIYHLISYTFLEPCSIRTSGTVCFIFRANTNVAMMSMSFLEFAIVIERSVALWKRTSYEHKYNYLGVILGTLAICAAYFITLTLMWGFSFEKQFLICSPIYMYRSLSHTSYWSLINMAVECLSLIGVMTIYFICHQRAKRRLYNLRSRYDIRVSFEVLAGIMPTMTIHTIWALVFNAIQIPVIARLGSVNDPTLKAFGTLSNFVPLYTALAPLVLILMHHRNRKTSKKVDDMLKMKTTQDLYFDTYKKVW